MTSSFQVCLARPDVSAHGEEFDEADVWGNGDGDDARDTDSESGDDEERGLTGDDDGDGFAAAGDDDALR